MTQVITGEYMAAESVDAKALKLAQSVIDARETVTFVLEGEVTLHGVKSVLLATLQRLHNRDDREALSAAVRKAMSRERERMHAVAVKYRAGELAVLPGESESDALMRNRRLRWLSPEMTLSLKTAKADKLDVSEKTTESYLPKIAAPVESVTVTDSNDGAMLTYWRNRAEKAEAAQLALAQEIKSLDAQKAEIISQYERANRERGELYREIADLKSRIEEQAEELEKLEKQAKPRNRKPKTA
jgi:hypothetical protein